MSQLIDLELSIAEASLVQAALQHLMTHYPEKSKACLDLGNVWAKVERAKVKLYLLSKLSPEDARTVLTMLGFKE